MKTWMKTTIVSALVASTAFGGAAALARGGDCDGMGPYGGAGWQRMAPEQMQQKMSERTTLGLARLELALALTPQQQPAWNAFKSAMTARSERMAQAMAQRTQAGAPQTAIERMQRQEEMGRLRQSELAESRKAVESFYATLSAAQKTVFDAEFQRLGHDRHGMHKGMGRSQS